MSHKEAEVPLDQLLIYLRNSVDSSIEAGYVTNALADNMSILQDHSAMSHKSLSRIAAELERFGRINAEDMPTLLAHLKKTLPR
jgi:hypothetical protein